MQEEVDERDVARLLPRRGGEQSRQRQAEAEDAGDAEAQHVAAMEAVAEGGTNGHVAPRQSPVLKHVPYRL